MNDYLENRIELIGTIVEKIEQQSTYEMIRQERLALCKIVLDVQRGNGEIDKINVFIEKEELKKRHIGKGLKVSIEGVIHTYNEYDSQNKMHVITYVRAWSIRKLHSDTMDKNKAIMVGLVSQTPTRWKASRGGRANFNLCTNDLKAGITSFVPCVAKSRMADILCELEPWEELSFEGRLQSREYTKTLKSGLKEEGTAFEVIVIKLI